MSTLPENDLGLCWSCQVDLTLDLVVLLDSTMAIQCCRNCWKQIPADRRVSIALMFHDRTDVGLGVGEACSAIIGFFEAASRRENHFRRFELGDDEEQNWGMN